MEVHTPAGEIFGWIDRKGEIHKDNLMPNSDIDPDATLRGKIIGQLDGKSFYVNNEVVGKWMK
ncbi:MAG: hypothetical protein IPM96_21985 [Ignavibacteria bacterium]|nr:hypothetical protein [Ignavibacteria bacterium]